MEEQLKTLVEKALNVAEKTGEFAIEQAPLSLQEFYRWHLAKNIFIAISSLLAIIIIYKVFKTLGSDVSNNKWDIKILGKYYDEIFGPALSVIYSISGLLLITFAIHSSCKVLFITIAPKLYLIEYFLK